MPEMPTHVIIQVSKPNTWHVCMVNHLNQFYTILCVCTDYDDASYICNALNKAEAENI